VRPPDVILIHGNGGCTAADIWLPWVERELTRLGLNVVNRTFPDNVRARAAVWLPFIEELGAGDNTILIGHSSGAVAAMRHAETHRLLGSILVGVCYTDLGDGGEAASGYYRDPWQWERIRENRSGSPSTTRPTIRTSPSRSRGWSPSSCSAATLSFMTVGTSPVRASSQRSCNWSNAN